MHLLDTVFWLTSFTRTWMLLIKTVLIYIDYFWQIDIIDYFWQICIKLHVHSIKTTINYFIFKLKKSWHWWNWKLQDKIRYNVFNNVQRLLQIFNFFFLFRPNSLNGVHMSLMTLDREKTVLNTKINVLTMRDVQQHWNIYVQSHHVCINNTKYHIVGIVQKSRAKS